LTLENEGALFAPGDNDQNPEENAESGNSKTFEENAGSDNGKSFEENMARLEQLVRQLERGELSLEDALVCYQEGVRLVGFCQKSLERTTKEVEILTDSLVSKSEK